MIVDLADYHCQNEQLVLSLVGVFGDAGFLQNADHAKE
jgi:hypothetical protein